MATSLPQRFGISTTKKTMPKVCRLCCSAVSPTHCLALFSYESVQKVGRLSKLLDLPVSSGDGLSPYPCRSCMNKFYTVQSKLESLRTLAKVGYEKSGQFRSVVPACSSVSTVQPAKKRTKDTCGVDTSLHTVKARPLLVYLEDDLLSLLVSSLSCHATIKHKAYTNIYTI